MKTVTEHAENVENDVVLTLRDQTEADNPAAEGKLVFRNPQSELLQLADRGPFFEELQLFLDEVRNMAENLGKKHGVKLNMETVFDIQRIKFKASQLR